LPRQLLLGPAADSPMMRDVVLEVSHYPVTTRQDLIRSTGGYEFLQASRLTQISALPTRRDCEFRSVGCGSGQAIHAGSKCRIELTLPPPTDDPVPTAPHGGELLATRALTLYQSGHA
jgi:hypothetical protein